MMICIKKYYCYTALLLQILPASEAKLKNADFIAHSLLKACAILEPGKNKYKWDEWNGLLLLNAIYCLQEIRQILFLPDKQCY